MDAQKEALALAEVASWQRKQQKIFDANSAKWEARLAEMLEPTEDSDSLPGSAALTKAGARRAQTAAAAQLAEQRARSPVDGGASDFAGKDARNSFFEVFKRESKRRQEEGTGTPSKLTVDFSQPSYILMTYRVVGEQALHVKSAERRRRPTV
eukprot:COSAG03_NODE_1308_length_4349_cov_144.623059_6_plen_153_part_00